MKYHCDIIIVGMDTDDVDDDLQYNDDDDDDDDVGLRYNYDDNDNLWYKDDDDVNLGNNDVGRRGEKNHSGEDCIPGQTNQAKSESESESMPG